MNTPPPQSIPADKFKPRFDTTTTAGKIAVMQEAERVEYVYLKVGFVWIYVKYPLFDKPIFEYNFPTEPKRTLVPWTKDTVPREAWIKTEVNGITHESRILVISSGLSCDGISTRGKAIHFNDLLDPKYSHSLDNGRTWLPCGTWKEEEEEV